MIDDLIFSLIPAVPNSLFYFLQLFPKIVIVHCSFFFFFFIKQIMILKILNLAGYQNCRIGSKVTTILMKYEKMFAIPCVS